MSDITPRYFKIKLTDNRYFKVSAYEDETSKEYILSINSKPILSNKIGVLLKQSVLELQIFSAVNHQYFLTELEKENKLRVLNLIRSTALNRYNLLFGEILIES